MIKFLMSFVHACRGIAVAFQEQRNLVIHGIAAILVVLLGFYFEIRATEWIAMVMAIGLVITAELVNTAIENIVDLVSPTHHALAGKIKDIAAGAVLIASLSAAIVGVIIFSNYVV